ncbi:MAG: hypothetical protein JWM87_762 [Candidatus Eremiobacteraeota bacterium]|nr:hypothetical protein [Candidatus Eremiobacteraeota bacterium]
MKGRQRGARYDPEPPHALCEINAFLREHLGKQLFIDYGFRDEDNRSYSDLATAAIVNEVRIPVEVRLVDAEGEAVFCTECVPASNAS